MTLLSFVIPCYRSEKTIRSVIDEIKETVSQRENFDYEIICVNDCSPDNVFSVICNLAEEDKK
jgi:Glycosyltransferases involved in cell wall biogenesis